MMDSPVFCTIITPDYYPIARAQFESLKKINPTTRYYIFLSSDSIPDSVQQTTNEGIILHTLSEVCKEGIGKKIREKYAKDFVSNFRWAMKPVILKYLLDDLKIEKVLYIDWDIYFYEDFSFLFDFLNSDSVLVTPHWTPLRTKYNLATLVGLYNGGFVGVNRDAISLMEWWAGECLFKCEVDLQEGYYLDQSYLHYFHLHDDVSVKVIKHRGCNVADWNRQECQRTLVEGKVMINNKFPIIFIHFSFTTVRSIVQGEDPLLLPYFEQFNEAVARCNNGVNLLAKLPIYKVFLHPPGFAQRLVAGIGGKIRFKKRWRAFIKGIG